MFPTRAHDLPSHGVLTKLTVPSINSLPWSKLQIQSEDGCLPPQPSCYRYTSGHTLPGRSVLQTVPEWLPGELTIINGNILLTNTFNREVSYSWHWDFHLITHVFWEKHRMQCTTSVQPSPLLAIKRCIYLLCWGGVVQWHMYGNQRTTCGGQFFLPLCRSWRSNSDHQVWWQAVLSC